VEGDLWKTYVRILVLLFLVVLARKAQAACGATTFQPISKFVPAGTTHNAYYLTDPFGEQRAVFDLLWGGAMASLKQNGVERVWGNGVGGMVQPAFHSLATGQDYNPTQAGNNGNIGSAVMGVRCIDANTLYIMSGTLDFNKGASGLIISNTVLNGAVVPNSYATPYTVVTIATFVPNPSGPPSYYLKLQQTITNIHPTTNVSFGFELAGYVPYSYGNYVRYPTACASTADNCYNSSTPDLLGGLYPNANLTGGTAFFVSPQVAWNPNRRSFASFAQDDINQNQSTHLFTEGWILGPGTARTATWYVLVGDWNKALNFAGLN
jgi:hypothetical protein